MIIVYIAKRCGKSPAILCYDFCQLYDTKDDSKFPTSKSIFSLLQLP